MVAAVVGGLAQGIVEMGAITLAKSPIAEQRPHALQHRCFRVSHSFGKSHAEIRLAARRLERDDPREARDGVVESPKLLQDLAEPLVRVIGVRSDSDRGSRDALGFDRPPEFGERPRQLQATVCRVGQQRQRVRKALFRVVAVAADEQQMAQSRMRLGKVGSEGDRAGERGCCVALPPLQLPDMAEIVVEDRKLRLKRDGALEARRGLRQAPLPEVADAEIIVGRGVARREPHRF
ncbi:MAG: hypothetical protein ABI541_09320 [Betaproteobacteria bacterium]